MPKVQVNETKIADDEAHSSFKAAAAQVSPVYMDRNATAEKVCRVIEETARQGANFVGFPECFIPGFPSWIYAASPIYETKKALEILVGNSVEIPSRITWDICEAARKNAVNVVLGVIEKDVENESVLYITQLFIGEDGRILGKHRKIVPTYAEKLLFTSGDGSTLRAFKTKYGELGGLNCGEHYNPMARFALIAQNIKIHVASWPMPGGYFREMIIPCARTFAFEGGMFVINSSAVITAEILEVLLESSKAMRQTYEQDLKTGGGVGCIINPYGQILAQANPDKEEIVYAECDLTDHYKAKAMHNLIGNYNRPEIFNLMINRRNFKLVTNVEEERPLDGAAVQPESEVTTGDSN